MKMKRLFVILGCLVILICSCLPAFASSYDNDDNYLTRRYYALVPFTSKSVSPDEFSTFHSSAEGEHFDVVVNQDGSFSTHNYSPVISEQLGYTSDGTLSVLNTEYTTTYYQQSSSYFAAYNMYDFQLDDRDPSFLTVTFSAEDFFITMAQWSSLNKYAKFLLNGAGGVKLTWNVSYFGLNSTGTGFTNYLDTYSSTVSLVAGQTVSYFPTWSQLFSDGATPINSGYVVEYLTLTIEFATSPSQFGLGMLYGQENPVVRGYRVINTETIVEVPVDQGFDPISWLAGPITQFFAIEFAPGFSIGKCCLFLFTFMLLGVVFYFIRR